MNTAAFYTNRALFESHFRDAYGLAATDHITDEDIWDYEADYYFSEWYDTCVEAGIPTAQSICNFTVADLFARPHAVDAAITAMPGARCFARLDTCSSKPDCPFYSAKEIAEHITASTRTQFVAAKDPTHRLILREWIADIDARFWEIRCFVVAGVLRGISGPHCANAKMRAFRRYLADIKTMTTAIVQNTGYSDCTVDLLIPRTCSDRLQLVEINTPVWLFATSGLFDITLPADVAILCGPVTALEDVVALPVWRTEIADGEIVIKN